MKKKKTPEKKHAKYSPSASSRWLACPGSVSLSALYPAPPESGAAIEGTNAHKCLETFLHHGPHKMLSVNHMLLEAGHPVEMVLHAEQAAKAVWAFMPPGSELIIEGESSCAHIDPDFYGTTDATIVEHFGLLHVIDFKYGKMPVDPGNNAQLMAYAIGMAKKFDYNFGSVRLTVIQPRGGGPAVRSWDTTIEHLFWWEDRFRKGIKATKRKHPEYMAGQHCFFCPAKEGCLEYTPEVTQSMRGLFVRDKTPEERKAQVALDFGEEPVKGKPTRSKK